MDPPRFRCEGCIANGREASLIKIEHFSKSDTERGLRLLLSRLAQALCACGRAEQRVWQLWRRNQHSSTDLMPPRFGLGRSGQPIEAGDDQHVISLQPVQQLGQFEAVRLCFEASGRLRGKSRSGGQVAPMSYGIESVGELYSTKIGIMTGDKCGAVRTPEQSERF
jgi:hypothetical protein